MHAPSADADSPRGRDPSPAPDPPRPPRAQKNHLSGLKRRLLRVSFWNVQQLMEARREVAPIVARNRGRSGVADALSALRAEQQAAMLADGGGGIGGGGAGAGPSDGGRVKVRGAARKHSPPRRLL